MKSFRCHATQYVASRLGNRLSRGRSVAKCCHQVELKVVQRAVKHLSAADRCRRRRRSNVRAAPDDTFSAMRRRGLGLGMTAYSFKSIDVLQRRPAATPISKITDLGATGDASPGITAAPMAKATLTFTASSPRAYSSVGMTFDPPGSSNTNGVYITAGGVIYSDYCRLR